jgi:predicted secreted hydrolase
MNRRAFVALPLLVAFPRAASGVAYPAVTSGTSLVFPRDHGSHPDFRTEWWYLTGIVRAATGADFGVQLTFFRSRPGIAEASGSRFAPRQLLFAHAALALPQQSRLVIDQRAARAGLGLAEAAEGTTDVRIDDWSLALKDDVYTATVAGRAFTLELAFRATQPPLLQGEAGVSRKGPSPAQASYYYSVPQLDVAGTIVIDRQTLRVTGKAWLDHEWSSEYLAAGARGWDWTGVNFDDGGALMAFRIRARDGSVLWAGGSHRDAAGRRTTFAPDDVRFDPLRDWRSPRTGVTYPVAFRVTAGGLRVTLEPLFDDQELDARASVGTVYWEGAVRARNAERAIGAGYLELTGYGEPLKL